MQIQTVKYVNASDLFLECPAAWNTFSCSDPNCSWGDNKFTLVSRDFVKNHLKEQIEHGLAEEPVEQTETVIERLDAIADDVFINLEG